MFHFKGLQGRRKLSASVMRYGTIGMWKKWQCCTNVGAPHAVPLQGELVGSQLDIVAATVFGPV